MPQQTRSSSFQLPALNIPSTSLTAGTNIPAPPPSPPLKSSTSKTRVLDEPPQTPLQTDSPNPLRSHPTSSHSLSRQYNLDAAAVAAAAGNNHANGHTQNSKPSTPTTSATAGGSAAGSPAMPKRTSTQESLSPPPAKRPMSVRKFLGLRSLSGAFGGRTSTDGGSSVYGNGSTGNRSTDKLSLFSHNRPESQASTNRPSLKKKRSSLMLLGKRGSSFLGLSVDEEPNEDRVMEGTETEDPREMAREAIGLADTRGGAGRNDRKKTPPPTLPGLDSLKASRGLHDQEGGYLGGGDMFRNIG